jgi:hypothetical protein
LNDLALELRKQGKYEEVEEMHRQELGLCKVVISREHPDTLASIWRVC